MKIGFLQLSDLHIESDSYLDKVDVIVNACSYDVKQVSHLYITITGDIAKFGRKEEYEKAKEFISSLREKIKPKNSVLQIKIIVVPGNHDCCFDNAKSTRKEIIKSCLKDIIEENDYFLDATAVQNNFWNFYKEVVGNIPADKISFKVEDTPFIGNKVVFNCYNSSWMSEINEEYGRLVIPQNKFLQNDNGDITISVFHHPLSWLSPNTPNNNKARFEEHLINSSNIVLFGHEHDKGQAKNMQQKDNNVIFAEGKAFQKDKSIDSGFSFLTIDLSDKNVTCKVFAWDNDTYTTITEETFTLIKKEKRIFTLTTEFATKIETLKIPLKHSRKEVLSLSDVFVFPDLEPIKDDDIIQYPNSEELLERIKKENNLKVVIEGEDQSGKTTLLFSIYKKLYERGFMPIYIRGKYVNGTDIKGIVKKAIKEQYNNDNIDLAFQQEKRVLLFDNMQNTALNPKYKATLLKSIDSLFDFIIVTTSNTSLSNLAADEITVLKDFEKYKLLPLGYEKRGELIEQWLRIGQNIMTVRDEEILKMLQTRISEVNTLIGNRLMPSYPIFILTILQSLDSQIFQDFTQTSYAHCYHALITAGLVKEGLKEHLNSYFNLLKELSYSLFKGKECFTQKTFEDLYAEYKKLYVIQHSSTQILQYLTNANILKFDDEYYSFSYKYIFYYLVAQKIAEDIDNKENLIRELCEKIHLEKNANILIFLTHHTKAQVLLDNIIFTGELPFENISPITLDQNDPFSKSLTEFVQSIQVDLAKLEDRNPDEELKLEQKRNDEIDRSHPHDEDSESFEMPPEVIEINQALRTIRILGQIVKNQKGDFEKTKLIELVDTSYRSTFRLVNFFSKVFTEEKDYLIDAIYDNLVEKNKKNVDFQKFLANMGKESLKNNITTFLQFIAFRVCLDSFNNLMFAVGTKGADEIYDAVTQKIDSPAAKIITFAIKSYYGSINPRNLEKLFGEVENNYIAKSILQIYVKKHLYTNNIERTKKEQIVKIAGFKPNMIIRKKPN